MGHPVGKCTRRYQEAILGREIAKFRMEGKISGENELGSLATVNLLVHIESSFRPRKNASLAELEKSLKNLRVRNHFETFPHTN